MDDAQLHTVWQQRQISDTSSHLSGPLAMLMKHTLGKRVKQLGKLAEIWDEVIPHEIREHTALDSFSRSVLTVMVDSSAHRFQLLTLLRGGLEKQIKARFSGSLDRIRCIPGQFYAVDLAGQPRYEF